MERHKGTDVIIALLQRSPIGCTGHPRRPLTLNNYSVKEQAVDCTPPPDTENIINISVKAITVDVRIQTNKQMFIHVCATK